MNFARFACARCQRRHRRRRRRPFHPRPETPAVASSPPPAGPAAPSGCTRAAPRCGGRARGARSRAVAAARAVQGVGRSRGAAKSGGESVPMLKTVAGRPTQSPAPTFWPRALSRSAQSSSVGTSSWRRSDLLTGSVLIIRGGRRGGAPVQSSIFCSRPLAPSPLITTSHLQPHKQSSLPPPTC